MDDFTKTRISKIMEKYTEAKVPKHLQNQIRLLVDKDKRGLFWG